MTDQTTTPPATSWPLAPGEHPDLPRLWCEQHDGTRATTGRNARPATAPYARYYLSASRVIVTSNPDRLRAHAQALLGLADWLEVALADFDPTPYDQLPLEEGC